MSRMPWAHHLLPPDVPRRLGIITLKAYDPEFPGDITHQQWKRLMVFAQLRARHARRRTKR